MQLCINGFWLHGPCFSLPKSNVDEKEEIPMCTLTSSINSVNVYVKMGGKPTRQRPSDTNQSSRSVATFLILRVFLRHLASSGS